MADSCPARRGPCDECPWRTATDCATQIPNFKPSLLQGLYRSCQDDGMAQMACHKSGEDNNVVCAGWVIVYGPDAVGVRLAMSLGGMDLANYDNDVRVDLWDSFDAMLDANSIERPPRNVFQPKIPET